MMMRKFLSAMMYFITYFVLIEYVHTQDDRKECFKTIVITEIKDGHWEGLTEAKEYEYTSLEECQENAEKFKQGIGKKAEGKSFWWGHWEIINASKCVACSEGSGSKEQSDEEAGNFEKRNRLMERDYLDKLPREVTADLFYDKLMDPRSRGTLINALGVYWDNLALKTFGTALFAVDVARAYNKLWQNASEAALQRALGQINLSREEGQKLLMASGAHLLSAPDKYIKAGDASLVQDAFLSAASYGSSKPTGEAAYTSAALLGAAGLIAAETGNKKAATILLSAAVDVLNEAPANTKRSEMENLLQNTSTSFSVDLKPPSYVSQTQPPAVPRSTRTVDTPDVSNIAGEYECVGGDIECPKNMSNPQMQLKISPLVITQTGSTIILKGGQFVYQDLGVYGWVKSNTEWEGRGNIQGDRVEIEWSSVTESSSSKGPHRQSQSGHATLRILSNREIQLSSTQPDGRTYTQIYRRQ